jgi:DNA-binding PadR family transcriptional regulator
VDVARIRGSLWAGGDLVAVSPVTRNLGVMDSLRALSLNDWAVLGLIAEGETHGFALSREFTATGAIGRIWTIPRPLVYRAITLLVSRDLVREAGWVTGAAAPKRRLVQVTDAGRGALANWLEKPVAHVRDARSELLVKLLLLDRADIDAMPLLRAQDAILGAMLSSLRAQLDDSAGFDATILRWRIYSTEALASFLQDLLSA